MKAVELMISAGARMILFCAAPACALALLLTHVACQSTASPPAAAAPDESARPVILLSTAGPATQPAGPSSVMVYIKMVVDRKYGVLAHIVGNRDSSVRDPDYDATKRWWENPLVVYADDPFAHFDVVGQADAEKIVGVGAGANVDVGLTLIPHAVVAMRTLPGSEGIKGTITVSISTIDDFYDGGWTEMVRTKDKLLTFNIDTCEPGRKLEQVVHENRTIPTFSLERYTRGHEKWEPRSRWPAEVKSGDSRTTIYGKDATLDVTGYRYAGQ